MSTSREIFWPDAVPRWYAVQTRPRQESTALLNLERQGYRVYLPRIQQRKRLRNRWRDVIEPLFPGYLFLRVDLDRDNVAPVRSTLGVRGLVRFGVYCQPLPDDVVEYLQERESALQAINAGESGFKPGDRVRILSGPFSGLEAVYEMDRAEERALLLIEIMGRCNRVAVARDDISAPIH